MLNILKSLTIHPKENNLEVLSLDFNTTITNIANYITNVTEAEFIDTYIHTLDKYGVEFKISPSNRYSKTLHEYDIIHIDIEEEMLSKIFINYILNEEEINIDLKTFSSLCSMSCKVFANLMFETIYLIELFDNTVMCRLCIPNKKVITNKDYLITLLIGKERK